MQVQCFCDHVFEVFFASFQKNQPQQIDRNPHFQTESSIK